ncbi:MAG: molybdopterin converting factor subunit 1 [Chromatiales bacterium]|nr:molybdopterin converting factor subunit 1 [Gammaproteobacteria bacterium]MCP5353016.1 molybdopterin converting factor subunit 1 [Chromatiales bacterium]
MIRVLYFARLREALGADGEQLAADIGNVGELKAALAARGGVWRSEFAENPRLLASVNQDMADDATPVADGDEVGFFPPVTGG